MPQLRKLAPAFLSLAAIAVMGTPRADAQKPAPVENVSTFAHRSPDEERKALHVPPGFEIQLVAAEPDIQKPLNLAFDDKGRLWITDTVEYPWPAKDGDKPRDTVKILSDFGPDGRARKIETFADGLNIPIGLLPKPSGREAIVHSIPNIYLLKDADGDGKAEIKQPLYGVFGNRDTHGMTNAFTWGYDGWIYACHGFSNTSEVAGKDKQAITFNSGNTYRMRPDGSHLEQITHGQVNPFGLAFDALGNLYSCDCHSRPVYQLLRGAYYPSFGKPDDGLGFGPAMVNHDHGSTGIGGIAYYTSDQFPKEYQDRVFVGNVVTNRINQDKVEWRGATPKGIEQPDFVWSEDNWFRPVDLELGPDGALYVADFYNRIIGHYEVPLTHPGRDRSSGRVWRIVYKGTEGNPAPPLAPPVDRTKSSVDSLIADLGGPTLPVRITAANQLVARGGQEAESKLIDVLKHHDGPASTLVHSLWALDRLDKLDDPLLLGVVEPPVSPTVQVHALKVLVDRAALPPVLQTFALRSITDPNPHVRRAAAEVLGAHADFDHIRPLLALRQSTAAEDTHLMHVARMALRDQFKNKEVWSRLEALTLNARDRADVADVAVAVPTAEAAAFLLAHIQNDEVSPANTNRYIHHVARYGPRESVPALLGLAQAGDRSRADRIGLLRMIQQGAQERGEGAIPEVQQAGLGLVRSLLDSKNTDEVGEGIGAVRDLQLKDAIPSLEKVFAREDLPHARRAEALSAVVVLDQPLGLARMKSVLEDGRLEPRLRESAAIALANLDKPEARAAVLEALTTAPEQVQATAAAALVRNRDGAVALLNAIAAGKASARLLQQRPITIGLENAKIPNLDDRMKKLLAGLPPADQTLRELLDARREGFQASPHDVAAGARVYESNCGICHQMEGKGARIGPQLDGVGARGLERLLEDVLDPNRNVDQMFRVTSLALKDGRVVAGLLLREEGAVLVIADALGKEVRVPKDEVEEKQIMQMSPMPADMARLIPERDFYHLLDYLLSRRDEKPVK